MRTIDFLGMITYAVTLLNLAYLIPAMSYFFAWQIKVRAILWLTVAICVSLTAYGLQMLTGFYRRYIALITDTGDTSPTAVAWVFEQLGVALGLTVISWLFYTRNQDRGINIPKRKKD